MNQILNSPFELDNYSKIIIALALYIGLCVYNFILRYMQHDYKFNSVRTQIVFLVLSLSVMVAADNMIIIFIAWCCNNLLIVNLMIHKPHWRAAKASGMLAAKNYLIGAVALSAALAIFYFDTGHLHLSALIKQESYSVYSNIALILLLLAAMTQSAIWPFHKWLISSLNSPTPISAIMHAGIINGGIFLVIRFAPLYLRSPALLTAMFCIGFASAIFGSFIKLLQNDVKRMLACSTVGQMGFSLAQCGLGLFPNALAHLLTHAMFKSYLFLESSSAAQKSKVASYRQPDMFILLYTIICGISGVVSFIYAGQKQFNLQDTTLIVMVVTFIAACQIALAILTSNKHNFKTVLSAVAITVVSSFIYGLIVNMLSHAIQDIDIMQPQSLNLYHYVAIISVLLTWLVYILAINNIELFLSHPWVQKAYVLGLNAGQPHSSSVTAHRNHYQYL